MIQNCFLSLKINDEKKITEYVSAKSFENQAIFLWNVAFSYVGRAFWVIVLLRSSYFRLIAVRAKKREWDGLRGRELE